MSEHSARAQPPGRRPPARAVPSRRRARAAGRGISPLRWRRTGGAIALTLRDWSGCADRLVLRELAGDPARRVRVVARGAVGYEGPVGAEGAEARIPAVAGEVEVAVRLEAIEGTPTPRLTELRLPAPDSDR